MHVHAWFDATRVFVTAMCVSHLWCHGNFIPVKFFSGTIFQEEFFASEQIFKKWTSAESFGPGEIFHFP